MSTTACGVGAARLLRDGGRQRAAEDVAILPRRLMALAGMDLTEEVDAKMAINRARTWRATGNGTGGHV